MLSRIPTSSGRHPHKSRFDSLRYHSPLLLTPPRSLVAQPSLAHQPPWSPSAACSWPKPSLDCQQPHRWELQQL